MKTLLSISLLLSSLAFSQGIDDDLSLDDAMWENTIWNEIEEVTTKEYEVEKVTTAAGVRGAEAEDEALHHLYYRQSMKGTSPLEIQRAYGKLINKRSKYLEAGKNTETLDKYISHLRNKIISIP